MMREVARMRAEIGRRGPWGRADFVALRSRDGRELLEVLEFEGGAVVVVYEDWMGWWL